MKIPTPVEHPISTVFFQVSKELKLLVPEIASVEETVSQLIKQSTEGRTLEISNLQKLDFLMQTITEIVRFLELTSAVIPDELQVSTENSARKIKLYDLALRLENPTQKILL